MTPWRACIALHVFSSLMLSTFWVKFYLFFCAPHTTERGMKKRSTKPLEDRRKRLVRRWDFRIPVHMYEDPVDRHNWFTRRGCVCCTIGWKIAVDIAWNMTSGFTIRDLFSILAVALLLLILRTLPRGCTGFSSGSLVDKCAWTEISDSSSSLLMENLTWTSQNELSRISKKQ